MKLDLPAVKKSSGLGGSTRFGVGADPCKVVPGACGRHPKWHLLAHHQQRQAVASDYGFERATGTTRPTNAHPRSRHSTRHLVRPLGHSSPLRQCHRPLPHSLPHLLPRQLQPQHLFSSYDCRFGAVVKNEGFLMSLNFSC